MSKKIFNWLWDRCISFLQSIFHNWAVFIVGIIILYIIFVGFSQVMDNQIIIHDNMCKEIRL